MLTRRSLRAALAPVALAVALLSHGRTPAQAATPDPNFLRDYAETFRFSLGRPVSITPVPGGDAVLFLRSGPRSFVRDLWSFDVATGRERVLLTADAILGGADESLSPEEIARRERQRLSARGIASYSLSPDGSKILVPLAGRLFIVDRATAAVTELPAGPGFPLDARFSPDGTLVVCVRENEVWVTRLSDMSTWQATTGAGGSITHGLSEFVAQEEMDRDEGWWLSPDAQTIVYQRTDVSGVETARIMDPADPTKAPQEWPYPRAGGANADVQLGLTPIAGGTTTWVQWDRERYPYLATVKWAEKAPLTILVQNRTQTEEVLFAVDEHTGATTPLLTERDEAWINLDQSYPKWLPDGSAFLWASERDGAWRLELRRRDGALLGPLTPLDFGLRALVAYDEASRSAIVEAAPEPIEKQVFRVPLAPTAGGPRRVTYEPAWHDAVAARDGSLWVHTISEADRPTRWIVKRPDGVIVGEIASVAVSPPAPNARFFAVTDRNIRAMAILPRDFDETRAYPVILSVYAGPHVQTVTRAAAAGAHMNQFLADHGYIVVTFDGRGTPSRGRAWERAIKNDLITTPLEDQVAALRALASALPQMDLARVGVYGWSFGGYFSAHAATQRPEVFHAACVGAPVADWTDYDTHYTERYMGLPDENPDGYRTGNVLTHVGPDASPMLILHGTADDNVYFTHSLKLSDALLRAGAPFELITLAGHTHRVTDPQVIERMYAQMVEFFDENLRSSSAAK